MSELFNEWERITGKHPSEEVRRLGIAIHNAYMREMGGGRYVWTERSFQDAAGDQRGRWDNIAIDVIETSLLDSPFAEPTIEPDPHRLSTE